MTDQVNDMANGETPPAISGPSPRELNEAELALLESMIDATSLREVLHAVATICFSKSKHIATNWQDAHTANHWCHQGDRIMRLANEVTL